ncbi:MAG: glycosyl transferase family 2 [Geminicoccaceae bacterium]|jgi:glycosyltransferase involved in cell wall biosynthesis|nr:glycosyl transferase family 2 [Geminicoccaceae bacterium]
MSAAARVYAMSETPLVSVVVNFLNEERFLAEAVETVLAQTYPHWELLLCDDGSTDGSSEIARAYARTYPGRVRYVEAEGHANIGKSAIRNLGIAHSGGELIAFLDADDVWLPHKLERQLAILREQPRAGMIYGDTLIWFSWTGDPADAARDVPTETGFSTDVLVSPPRLLVRYLQDEEAYPCMCSVLVRREVVNEVGAFESDYRAGSQDMVFHAKVFLHAPVYVSRECWSRYRQHSNSFWARMRQEGHYAGEGRPHATRHRYLNWLAGYLDHQRIDAPDVRRALDAALWPYRHPHLYRIRRRLTPPWDRMRGEIARLTGRPGL